VGGVYGGGMAKRLRKWRPEYRAQIIKLARRGESPRAIADLLGVSISTLTRWISDVDGLEKDYREARAEWRRVNSAQLIDAAEVGLLERARGYTYEEVQEVRRGRRVVERRRIVKHVAPDVGAAKYILANRARTKWDRDQVHDMGEDTLGRLMELVHGCGGGHAAIVAGGDVTGGGGGRDAADSAGSVGAADPGAGPGDGSAAGGASDEPGGGAA